MEISTDKVTSVYVVYVYLYMYICIYVCISVCISVFLLMVDCTLCN